MGFLLKKDICYKKSEAGPDIKCLLRQNAWTWDSVLNLLVLMGNRTQHWVLTYIPVLHILKVFVALVIRKLFPPFCGTALYPSAQSYLSIFLLQGFLSGEASCLKSSHTVLRKHCHFNILRKVTSWQLSFTLLQTQPNQSGLKATKVYFSCSGFALHFTMWPSYSCQLAHGVMTCFSGKK